MVHIPDWLRPGLVEGCEVVNITYHSAEINCTTASQLPGNHPRVVGGEIVIFKPCRNPSNSDAENGGVEPNEVLAF